MIFLFNSSLNPAYQDNFLKTLFLPAGWTNEFRYSCSSRRRNVSEECALYLQRLHHKEDVIIIFIDRWGGNLKGESSYSYIPVRLGKFLHCRKVMDRISIQIQLTDFVYPIDSNTFTEFLNKELISDGLPKLTNGNPENLDDGNYAIRKSISIKDGTFETGDIAWENSINAIANTHVFKSTFEKQFIFAKAMLRKSGETNPINPKLVKQQAFYHLSKNQNYDLLLSYIYPFIEQAKTEIAQVELDTGDALIALNDPKSQLTLKTTTINFNFKTKNIDGTNRMSVSIYGERVVKQKIDLPFTTRQPFVHNLLVVVASISVLAFTVINGLITIENGQQVLKPDLIKIILTTFQALSVLSLFLLTGRK